MYNHVYYTMNIYVDKSNARRTSLYMSFLVYIYKREKITGLEKYVY